MYLIVVKHAGMVMDVTVTDNPEDWIATDGRGIKERYPSATFRVTYIGDVSKPKGGRGGSK